MSKERWVVSELEKRYGVETTRRWLANLANLQLIGDSMADDIDRLADLLDVLLTDPQDGDVLKYEAASQRWKNATNGGSSPVSSHTVEITAAQIRDSFANGGIQLAPGPGPGKAIIDVSCLFVFNLGAPFTGAFQTDIEITTDQTLVSGVFFYEDITQLSNAFRGEGADDGGVVGFWLAGILSSWSGPIALLDNAPLYFGIVSEAAIGGDGTVTVISTVTTIDLP